MGIKLGLRFFFHLVPGNGAFELAEGSDLPIAPCEKVSRFCAFSYGLHSDARTLPHADLCPAGRCCP